VNNPEPLPPPAYEARDAETRVVAATAASLAAIVAVCLAVGGVIYHVESGRLGTGSRPGADASFRHGAVERTDIDESWDEIDRAAREHLQGYAWVDRREGIVRIPIDRAIDLVCGEQKPATPASNMHGSTP
jgi:hypothetical protein